MKKKYAMLLRVIIVEMIIAFIMSEMGIRIKSWLGNAIGVFLVFLPIEVLLFLASKDQNIKYIQRIISKFFFWFLIFCYIGGGVGKAIALK